MPNPQRLNAVFLRLESGSEPVREWLKSLPKDERKAIGEGHCLRAVQVADRQTARRSPTRRRLGGSNIADQSYRADTIRGRGPAHGTAAWVHQEDIADTE